MQRPRVFRLTRSGVIDTNPVSVTQMASSFMANAADGTVLLTRRDPDGLKHYAIVPADRKRRDSVLHLAQTVAANAAEVEEPVFLMGAPVVAVSAVGSRDPYAGRSSQQGADVAKLSGVISTTLQTGEWVAVVIRAKNSRESRSWRTWLVNKMGNSTQATHHSLEAQAVVMSLWAGASSVHDARNILRSVAAGMPGFDLSTRVLRVDRKKPGMLVAAAGAAALVGGIVAAGQPALAAEASLLHLGMLAGGAAIAGSVAYALGLIPVAAEHARRLMRRNLLPVPPVRLLPVKPPRREDKDKDGNVIAAFDGDYPLHRRSFPVGPVLPVSLVAPHAGADSGTASTASRIAPGAARSAFGPLLGINDGRPVYLQAAELWSGVCAFGQPGSGKSRLLSSFFAWSTLERVHASGVAGSTGRANTVIVFENKGSEGADDTERIARTLGDPLFARFDLAGSDGPRIDLFDIPGAPAAVKAQECVNALRYVFSDGSIMERSFDTLVRVFTAAFAMTDSTAQLGGAEPRRGPFYYASIFLGARTDELGVTLADAVRKEAIRLGLDEHTDLGAAAAALASMYDGVTKTNRAKEQEAPRNKVSSLLAASNYWGRPTKTTWDAILESHASVLLNSGNTANADPLPDELSRQMQSLHLYTLIRTIQRRCSGWQAQGRGVSIFADELKLLVGASPAVVQWAREQGRSFGVKMFLGSQQPHQLPPDVLTSAMGMGTVLNFAQNEPRVVDAVVRDLNLAGEPWESADVVNLPKYELIARTPIDGQRQIPFTVKVPDFIGTFERDVNEFVRMERDPSWTPQG